jgi:hypothetical protein
MNYRVLGGVSLEDNSLITLLLIDDIIYLAVIKRGRVTTTEGFRTNEAKRATEHSTS